MKKSALLKMLSFAAPDLREQIEALPARTALIGISLRRVGGPKSIVLSAPDLPVRLPVARRIP